MRTSVIVALFIFSAALMGQDDDLAVVKERMNSYLDQRMEYVQDAKDCVFNAATASEVQACKAKLLDTIEDFKQRAKDNKNDITILKE